MLLKNVKAENVQTKEIKTKKFFLIAPISVRNLSEDFFEQFYTSHKFKVNQANGQVSKFVCVCVCERERERERVCV